MADPQNINPYGGNMVPTFEILDKIATLLGTTKMTFVPLFGGISTSSSASDQLPYGSDALAQAYTLRNDAGGVAPATARPHQHCASGLFSYQNVTTVRLAAAADNAGHSFGSGLVDAPFSAGIWVLVAEALGTVRSLIAKYSPAGGVAREYDFRFDATGQLELELFDESVGADETATAADGGVIVPFAWNHCVATYDGGETDPRIHIYLNGVDQNAAGLSVENGDYIAMEDLGTVLTIGCRDDGAGAAAQSLQGRVALPFITGKELSADEVSSIYHYGRMLLGLD